MEILILPILVFIFVLAVIILFNRLSNFKKKVDKSWNALQIQLKKQIELPTDQKSSHLDSSPESARNEYNKIAAQYNKIIQKFPTSIMAGMAGYSTREMYKDE